MPVEIVMPRLSDTMETGTIARWLKHEGDDVKKGEQLADIETDKATMPYESYASGRLSKILVAEGQSAAIGTPIAVIAAAGEAVEATPTAAVPAPAPMSQATATSNAATAPVSQTNAESSVAAGPPAVPASPANADSHAATGPATAPAPAPSTEPTANADGASSEMFVRASPIARRLAEEMSIDLQKLTGTGPGGRVTREDVEAASQSARPSPAASTTAAPVPPPTPTAPATVAPPGPVAPDLAPTSAERPLTRIQQTIARRMVQSKTTVPHFYVTVEVDMAAAARLRDALNEAWPDARVGFTDLIVKAATLALQANPIVNASWSEDRIVYHADVNVGVAVAVDGGLLVPVLHQVNQLDLRTLSRRTKELIQRTRDGKSIPGDFEGGTFTVSSLGQYPIQNFLAIVNPPESAILAVSRIEKRPVARDDAIVLSETVYLSLSCDHRVFYGTQAAEYATKLKELLEQPLSLVT